jgi:hypothetical protein
LKEIRNAAPDENKRQILHSTLCQLHDSGDSLLLFCPARIQRCDGSYAGIMVSPILIFEFVILKIDMDINEIMETLDQLHWLTWIALPICGLAIFYLLYKAATRAKEAARG